MARWLGGAVGGIVAGALAFAPAALASGPTYCVGEPSCPGETLGEAGNGEQLQAALKKAGENAESTLLIGEGTYSRTGGFTYDGGPVTIRGTGDETILTDDGVGGSTVLSVKPAAKAVAAVSHLAIRVPKAGEPPKGQEQFGLSLQAGAQLENVNVNGGGGNQDLGVSISKGASFSLGAVQMPLSEGEATGVEAFGGTVSRCLIVAAYGFAAAQTEESALKGCAIEASKVGLEVGPEHQNEGKLLAEDDLVDVDMPGAMAGVLVRALEEHTSSATLRGLTIIGGKRGVMVEAQTTKGTTTSASAVLESSVSYESTQAATDEYASAKTGTVAKASLLARYSDLAGSAEQGSREAGEPKLEQEGSFDEPPDFVNATSGEAALLGNWRPAPGSPLIDAGKPGPLEEGEFTTDLEGEPRIVHGRRDIGAFEYQFRPPTATATATPATAFSGQPVTFTGSASTTEPGDSIASSQWSFDDGAAVPAGLTATHAFTTPGLHTATLTVTDAAGVQASTTVRVLVQVTGHPGTVCNHCCGLNRCINPITGLTRLTLHPSRFRALRKGSSVLSPSAHGGTLVTLGLTRQATVMFTPERVEAGVTHGGRCLAPRHGLHGHRCTRLVALRSFTHGERAGTDTLRFSGRIAGHPLPPGRYELMASVGGSTLSVAFTIVK